MRTYPFQYQTTHPWITFELDLKRVPWDFCLLVGQMISHFEHLAGVPLPPEPAQHLALRYAVRGAHASAALEGNTLTEAEIFQRLGGELQLPPSKEYLGTEVDNVIAAAQWIERQHEAGALPPFSTELIGALNRRVLAGLHFEEEVIPGRLRGYSIGVADYRGAPAEDLDELMTRLSEWIARPWFRSPEPAAAGRDTAGGNGSAATARGYSVFTATPLPALTREQDLRWMEAILKAVLVHLYLMWIYPYDAGNGPTARLAEFYILIAAGIPRPAAHLLAKHYDETRSEYLRQLSETGQLGGDAIRFCLYAVRGFVDQLRELLDAVRDEQARLFWRVHVSGLLDKTDADRRRRDLVLDLAERRQPMEKYDLPEVSPRVAGTYATLNEKTFTRDLDALTDLGLLEKDLDGRYRAKTEIVRAYPPLPT